MSKTTEGYIDFYNCEKCGDEWSFIPEDFDIDKMPYPTVCAFCCMPKRQLFKDVYKEEGFWQAIWEVLRRIK